MTDTELLIRETLQSYAEDAELTDLVAGAKVRSRQLERRRSTRRSTGFAASFLHDRRMLAVCGLAAVVLLVGGVFVLGGTTSRNTVSVKPVILPAGRVPLNQHEKASFGPEVTDAGGSGSASASAPGDAPLSQVASARPASPTAQAGLRGIAATRVVKTGSLGLRVAKGQVGVTVAKLTTIASGAGGYVSRSHTGNVAGAAYGSATLRVPVNRFAETVAAAGRLGKQTSLTTSSQDVTGEYVDLRARLTALEKTRQTYLTILGHARTIGQTLAVQQHVNDIQQQIEERQGELKVLRNQSSDATLQVSVSEPGSPTTVGPGPKPRHGLNKAWHTSIDRFSRGIDSIVAALGPLLLALLVVAAIGLLGFLGYRVVRRVTASA